MELFTVGRLSRIASALAIWGMAGILFAPSSYGDTTRDGLGEAERLATSMIEAAKFTVIHMNRAASSSNLGAAQGEASLAGKSGQDMVTFGRKAITQIEEVMAGTEMPREAYLSGEQAVCGFRAVIRHSHHWLLHTHHILMSDSLRGGIAHVLDGARHARIAGNHLLEAQSHLHEMVQGVGSSPVARRDGLSLVKGIPVCGLGEEDSHGREIFLDSGELLHGDPSPAAASDEHGGGHH